MQFSTESILRLMVFTKTNRRHRSSRLFNQNQPAGLYYFRRSPDFQVSCPLLLSCHFCYKVLKLESLSEKLTKNEKLL